MSKSLKSGIAALVIVFAGVGQVGAGDVNTSQSAKYKACAAVAGHDVVFYDIVDKFAVAKCQIAIFESPDNPVLWAYLAKSLYKNKQYSDVFRWAKKSADRGNASGQFSLGFLYLAGDGIESNSSTAAKWFRKSANQGNANAQSRLGVLYSNGIGVKKNYSTAAKWYQKAAVQGDAFSQYFLGSFYQSGKGVKRNYSAAAKWYRKAADQGDASAQSSLGELYDKGQGVKKNYSVATKWYQLAADQGNESAKLKLKYPKQLR